MDQRQHPAATPDDPHEQEVAPRQRWWAPRPWMVPVPAILLSAAAISVLLYGTCKGP
jgi:hypothetical protein